MSEKKVGVFIVEGPSDEAALGSIMKGYFSNDEVQFVVTHGDITLVYKIYIGFTYCCSRYLSEDLGLYRKE